MTGADGNNFIKDPETGKLMGSEPSGEGETASGNAEKGTPEPDNNNAGTTSIEEKQKKINSVRIDFERDNTLPELNKEDLSKLGKESKPVLLKKNIIEKNRIAHPDIKDNEYDQIVGQSLYDPDLVVPGHQDKPYFNFLSRVGSDKSTVVLLEMAETKSNYEIVNFHWLEDSARTRKEKKGDRIEKNKQNQDGRASTPSSHAPEQELAANGHLRVTSQLCMSDKDCLVSQASYPVVSNLSRTNKSIDQTDGKNNIRFVEDKEGREDMSEAAKPVRFFRHDSIQIDSSHFTQEGYLVDTPIVTRIGILEYTNPDGSVRREFRPPEEVFDKESLASYEGKPVILTHNAIRVDKDNVDEETVGTMLTAGYPDGENVRAKIIIHNTDEVTSSGLRELSLGYDLEFDETPGEWNGDPYDVVQRKMRINHLALVKKARVGHQARLNLDEDNNTIKGAGNMTKQKSRRLDGEDLKNTISGYEERRKRRLDEAAAEAAGTGAAASGEAAAAEAANGAESGDKVALVKQRRSVRDQAGDPADPEEAKGIIGEQDADIAALLEYIEELQAKSDFAGSEKPAEEERNEDAGVATGGGGGTTVSSNGTTVTIQTDSVDAIVRERLKLGRIGDELNLDGLEEMKPLDAKKAIVKKVNPAMRLDGRSETYINAAFDAAIAQIGTVGAKDCNYQRRQMSGGRLDGVGGNTAAVKSGAAMAREKMIERQMNGGTAE